MHARPIRLPGEAGRRRGHRSGAGDGLRGIVHSILLVLAISMSTNAFGGLFSGTPPTDLGVRDGRLKPCPDRPNCVCSQSGDPARYVEPFAIKGSAAEALARLKAAIVAMPRARVVEERENYLRAEFRSRLLGFVDDFELYADTTSGVIHVRSASRLGRSDFGVNRKRVETVKAGYDGRRG